MRMYILLLVVIGVASIALGDVYTLTTDSRFVSAIAIDNEGDEFEDVEGSAFGTDMDFSVLAETGPGDIAFASQVSTLGEGVFSADLFASGESGFGRNAELVEAFSLFDVSFTLDTATAFEFSSVAVLDGAFGLYNAYLSRIGIDPGMIFESQMSGDVNGVLDAGSYRLFIEVEVEYMDLEIEVSSSASSSATMTFVPGVPSVALPGLAFFFGARRRR